MEMTEILRTGAVGPIVGLVMMVLLQVYQRYVGQSLASLRAEAVALLPGVATAVALVLLGGGDWAAATMAGLTALGVPLGLSRRAP